MKLKRIAFMLLVSLLFASTLAKAQDMDTELSKMTSELAAKIKANGCKKVAVLDFTDLQGQSSELGRYVAEQLTVDLVMDKDHFAVMDRANLKSILAEHKLTSTGLINPDTAKQLGRFSGVDALIIGNIASVGSSISVIVKVITTETAEVVAAGKTKFKSDETLEQLLSATTQSNDSSNDKPATKQDPMDKPFGDLQAKIKSLNVNLGDGRYGYATLILVITNTSKTLTYGVSANPDFYHKFNLTNRRGDVFQTTDVNGIETAYESFGGQINGSATDIAPRSAITIVAKSQVRWSGKAGEYPPYSFQTEVIFGVIKDGQIPNHKKYNIVLEEK